MKNLYKLIPTFLVVLIVSTWVYAANLPPTTVMTATTGGTVPTPPNNTTTFLRGDATFAAPSVAMSSLTAPTASNSLTATVDTSQTLLGHFDTSATSGQVLLFLGEDVASTKTGAINARPRILQLGTLAGSTAAPLAVTMMGQTSVLLLSPVNGNFIFSGVTDAVSGFGGGGLTFTGGASASANAAGSMSFTGGGNSSSGAGGGITFTPGTSASGTAGVLSLSGPWQYTSAEADLTYTYNTPTTGQTVTLAAGTETAIIEPAGTLATLTVTLPGCTTAYDGKLTRFSSTQVVTALTVNATSGTVVDAPASLAVGGGNGYLCRGSTAKWYRLY